jgi:hypothetical protein
LAACGGDRRNDQTGERETAETRPVGVSETGCLTARGDQFVLTDLKRAGGTTATTETFQLIGMDEVLRQHVGKQVRVAGEAEGSQVAVVTESTPGSDASRPAGTTGGAKPTGSADPADPKVTTDTQTRMEVRKLRVGSVEPTGESCAEETNPDDTAAKPRQ